MADGEGVPPAIVLDAGSTTCRAGLAGSDTPQAVFPSVVTRPRLGQQEYVGQEALARRTYVGMLKYPIEHGAVTNWDDMEKIWHHAFFKELRVAPEDQPLFMTESPVNPIKADREQTTQIMFETFTVPAFCMAHSSTLSLYRTGATTGVVLQIGGGVANAVPVHAGCAVFQAGLGQILAGECLTDYLVQLLLERGYSFITSSEQRDTVRNIKENLCYVVSDFEQEMQAAAAGSSTMEQTYELPDGHVITIGNERFRCPEALFQPSLTGSEAMGIHELIGGAIARCEPDLRAAMRGNVLVSGCSSLFPGLADRLQRTLRRDLGGDVNVTCTDTKHAAWTGGSMLAEYAAYSSYPQMWISREEYDETGPAVVARIGLGTPIPSWNSSGVKSAGKK